MECKDIPISYKLFSGVPKREIEIYTRKPARQAWVTMLRYTAQAILSYNVRNSKRVARFPPMTRPLPTQKHPFYYTSTSVLPLSPSIKLPGCTSYLFFKKRNKIRATLIKF